MQCEPCYPLQNTNLVFRMSIKLTMDVLINRACLYLGIEDPEILRTKSREGKFVGPRQMIMAALCYYKGFTLTEIGKWFGGRDHTTVIHSKAVVKDYCDTEPEYKENYLGMRNAMMVG